MKTKLFILLFLFFTLFSIGQTNVIQVRKVTYDTSFYTKKTYDTAVIVNNDKMNIPPMFGESKSGYWHDNIFFDNDSLYVFTNWIKKRKRRIAQRNPEKFWKIIERKKKRKKCQVYSVGYKFYEILTTYRIDTVTTTHYQITDNSTLITVKNDSLVIFSDTTSSELVYRSYWFTSDYDSILINRTKEGMQICNGNQSFFSCLFPTMVRSLKNHYAMNRAFGFYRYSGKINNKKYKMYLNMQSHLIRKAIILEDRSRFYCDFAITKDSLFIYNSPAGEIHTGRVGRKKNRIKFRNSNKKYNFYKKRKYFYPFSYYNYDVDS